MKTTLFVTFEISFKWRAKAPAAKLTEILASRLLKLIQPCDWLSTLSAVGGFGGNHINRCEIGGDLANPPKSGENSEFRRR